MRTLVAPTEPFVKTERTRLAADASAGSNVLLSLENNDGIIGDAFIAIGYEGSELAELQLVNQEVSGESPVRVAALKFNHQKGEPVTVYRYNQRKFYGSTSANGTYLELTADGSPKDIQVDDPQGTTLEYTGDTATHFKATYYNSETNEETAIGDSVAAEADESARYASLWAIRKHAGLAGNPLYSDFRMEMKRKQAENEINSAIGSRYTLPLGEVPPLLSYICELMAAGYIDYEEFGADGQGGKWLGEARALLKAVQGGTQLLLGADGVELGRVEVPVAETQLGGYPNDECTDAAQFSMGDRF
ncbi:phage gp36-like protein [Nitrobacter vulgaris]|uniref:phage protein Gp36 family protein n=1 Tax=Nitrobacter vulgaris TaxID=29421 RepID=UPI0028661358|nr:phage protein Gp36 family protein [Nitrobacter vulgaris]MDR6305897.1 phage gp36-like protein [Nitrobacter vulgaris]